MKKYRNVLATVAGFIIGSVVNMILVALSGKIIPFPAGVNNNTAEGLAAGMHLMNLNILFFLFWLML